MGSTHARRSLVLAVSLAGATLLAACSSTSSPVDATGGSTTVASTGSSAPSTTSSASTSSTPSAATKGSSRATPGYPSGKQRITLEVAGTARTAVLVVPEDVVNPAPLVLAFHGHGGSGGNFDKKMDAEALWPEAIIVYPDGLVGHKGITDPEGAKPGWQTAAGEDGDRDIAFYDVLMADLQAKLHIDPQRIYLMGHSNGSAFVSYLLNARGDTIAATANLSAQAGRLIATDPVRSMFMMMGEKDPTVPYANQARSIPLAEEHLGVDTATKTVDGYLTSAKGPNDIELVTYIHPEGHEVPDAVPPLVVAFFQRHTLPA
jgi:polyhydroxybutyrate depolymerase